MNLETVKKIFFCLFYLLIAFCNIAQYTSINKSAYTRDLLVFKKVLQEAHPSLHQYLPKEEWESLFHQAHEKLTRVQTDLEFLRVIMPLAQRIGDAHMDIKLKKSLEEDVGRFVVPVHYMEGNLLVAKTYKGIPKAARIIRINEIPTSELMARLVPYAFTDANNPGIARQIVGLFFERFMYYEFGPQQTFDVEFIPYGESASSTVRIQGSDESYADEKYWDAYHEVEYDHNELGSYPINSVPHLDIIEDPEIVRLIIPTFNVPTWFFERMLKKQFEEIEDLGVENLIVDVRDNTGGIIFNAVTLFSLISDETTQWWESCFVRTMELPELNYTGTGRVLSEMLTRKFKRATSIDGKKVLFGEEAKLYNDVPEVEHRFEGNTVVLFNGRSCSAASAFAHFATRSEKIYTVGSESGSNQGLQTAGWFADYILPKSQIRLHFGLISLQSRMETESIDKRGVMPKVLVENNRESLYYNTDDQLQAALDIIYQLR